MIGKIIAGLVGARAARHTRGVNESGGALMGIATMAMVRRFGPAGMIAAAVGGYALKRYNEKRQTGYPRPRR